MAEGRDDPPRSDLLSLPEATDLAGRAEALVRAGDLDAAVGAFRAAWPSVADDDDGALAVAACLRVLVRLGNTDRALDLLLPRLDRLAGLASDEHRMWLAATAAWVLEHARRLGMAPGRVGHESADAAQERLRTRAEALAADAGPDVARRLADAHDDADVAAEPTLAPTRLPRPADPAAALPPPASAAEVLALADRARQWRRTLDPGLERLLRGWLVTREAALELLTEPAHWSAAALLDLASVHLLREPLRERIRLDEALAAAERAGDAEGAAHARTDLAVLDVAGGPGHLRGRLPRRAPGP